jgi:hypothetical protein
MGELPEVYDEKRADDIVINNLLKEIRKLKENTKMVLGDKKGNLYKVADDDAELLTPEQIADLLDEAKADVALLESAATPTSTDPSPAPTAQDSSQGSPDSNADSSAMPSI